MKIAISKGGFIMTDILMAEDTINFISDSTLDKKGKRGKFYIMCGLIEAKCNRKYNKLIKEHVIKDNHIKDGRAILKGTRITVEDVLYIAREAQINDEKNWQEYIFKEYPSIQNQEQILAAVVYFIKHEISTINIISGVLLSKV